MPAIPATWLVGSVEGLPAQSVSIGGGADVEVTGAGNWYLRHPLAALSLIDQLDAALTAALGSGTVRVRRDRLVELSSNVGFSFAWSTPDLPALLGFLPNALAGEDTYVADAISPLLFSAGWPATLATGAGQAAFPVEDEHSQISAAGDIVDSEFHNAPAHQSFAWSNVMNHRVRRSDLTSDLLQGGTWHRFRQRVLLPNFRWQAYESVTEDSASSDPVTWPLPMSTYKRRSLPPGRYERTIPNANIRWGLAVDAIVQPEYPANA